MHKLRYGNQYNGELMNKTRNPDSETQNGKITGQMKKEWRFKKIEKEEFCTD